MRLPAIALAVALGVVPAFPQAATAFPQAATEDVQKKIAALEAELARLKAQGSDAARLDELARRIDLLAAEMEKARTGGATDVEAPTKGEPGLGPAASKIYSRTRGVSIGGYGEVLFGAPSSTRQDRARSDAHRSLDLLRYVQYVGYKFSDKILLNSEVEFEHATSGEGAEERGEVSVEFAYLEFRPWKNVGFRAGELLMPLGFLNELHEPPIFLGARRNEVEGQIIPATWAENGAGLFGQNGPFQWRSYVVAGLNSAGFAADGIREGRQHGSQSLADDVAFTGRLDFVGAPGLLLGGSVFVGNSGQRAEVDGQGIRGRVTLFDVHAQYEHRGFQARALYARSTIGDAALINAHNGLARPESIGSRQYGFYAQAAYDLMTARPHGEWAVVPFVRYERLNPQDQVPAGFEKELALDQTLWTAGLSVKPLHHVVVKGDYQWVSNKAREGVNRLNLAVGYLF